MKEVIFLSEKFKDRPFHHNTALQSFRPHPGLHFDHNGSESEDTRGVDIFLVVLRSLVQFCDGVNFVSPEQDNVKQRQEQRDRKDRRDLKIIRAC